MSRWDASSDALAGVPDLGGARCRGRWAIWDETEDPEIVQYAINQCEACSALVDCKAYAATQKRLTGVVGGRLYYHHQLNKQAAA
jgi:hypothetical protein